MATISKANRPRCTPALTRNGKVRLKPFNLAQLRDMFEKSSAKKAKSRIRNRILVLEKRERKLSK